MNMADILKQTFTYALYRYLLYGDWPILKIALLNIRRGFVFLITFGKVRLK